MDTYRLALLFTLSQECLVYFELFVSLSTEASSCPACMLSPHSFSYTVLNTQPSYIKAAL